MGRAARTVSAYRADWVDWARWCDASNEQPLPARAPALAAYVDELTRTRRVSTAQRRLAAIRAVHLDAGHLPPTDASEVGAAVTRAQWRQRDTASSTTPLAVEDLRAMSVALPATIAGIRDRALLLVGYGAALRPGELVQLTVDAVSVTAAGIRVTVARRSVVVPFGSEPGLCAVRAWKEWKRAARITDGAAFRAVDRHGRIAPGALGEKAVTRIVRRAAARIGLEPTRYTGLSLRRGTVVAAAERGATHDGIMFQTGHRSRRLVRRYVRESTGDPQG